MIKVTVKSEFGEYTQEFNHGHKVSRDTHKCIGAYEDIPKSEDWSKCPCCELKPKIWTFNGGMSTACGCGNSIYDHFSVCSESIMSVHSATGGKKMNLYRSDNLRKNWNEYCATMINPCNHSDLFIEGKW